MTWRVAGTYFESCNCDAICPCRSTAVLAVDEAGFEFRYSGVCGFTTSFDYHSD